MAEAFARIHGAGKVEAFSAGSRPSGRINPRAVEAMREVGYDLTTHTSKGLDEFNGHQDTLGNYHYHSSRKYPYVNGGLRGEVKVEDDHITPQPATVPVRPAGTPLHGAKIVGFTWPGPNRYSLEYTVGSEHRLVNYAINGDGTYTFDFVDSSGNKRTETYRKMERGSRGGRKPRPDRPPER